MTRKMILTAGALTAAMSLSATPAPPANPPTALSGLWETETSVALVNGDLERAAAKLPKVHSGPLAGVPPEELELMSRVKLWSKPPYNPEWNAKALKPAPEGSGQVVKGGGCGPSGFPAVMENPTPDGLIQIVITQAETLILSPSGDVRQVYTDGRPHPAADDIWPTFEGDSIGRWTGATLRIDTIARRSGPVAPLPVPGLANLSDRAHFVEQLRLIDANTMQNDMTIDDPERFSNPWQFSIRYRRVTDVDRLMTTNCVENDRDTIVNGKLTIAPSPSGK